MDEGPKFVEGVPIGRIFLALNNPRHETYDNEGKVITYLCQKESVYVLAKDIVKYGLNPLERFALTPTTKKRDSTAPTYVSAEGNRRLCALKFLNDPELAPAKLRDAFERLAKQWDPPITKVRSMGNRHCQSALWRRKLRPPCGNAVGSIFLTRATARRLTSYGAAFEPNR
jgi:hypothetical protein